MTDHHGRDHFLCIALRPFRSAIYDAVFAHVTAPWYASVLRRIPAGARVLDVGVGTGRSLAGCAEIVRSKGLKITALDVDSDYLECCSRRLAKAGLRDHVHVIKKSFEEHRGGRYDAICFNGSFMLLSEQSDALAHALSLLKPNSPIFLTLTLQRRRSALIEFFKPRLGAMTTIEFGGVTYRDHLEWTLAQGGLAACYEEVLASGRTQDQVLIEARPINGSQCAAAPWAGGN